MAGPTRPTKPPQAAAVAHDARVNFGDPNFYSGGGGIPEGNYVLYFDTVIHTYQNQAGAPVGGPFLAVRVAAYALENPNTEPSLGYYSMGGKAILSFAPNADDEGKSLLAIPGGPATGMSNQSNWSLFYDSLLNCGLPVGVFTNDLRALDGVWVHMVHVPEPESRKDMPKNTGDTQEEARQPRKISVVGEIFDGGKPWEGGGGIPEAATAPPAKVTRMPARTGTPTPPATPAPRPAPLPPAARTAPAAPAAPAPRRAPGRPAAPAPPPPADETPAEDEELLSAAQNAAASVIEKTPNGVPKLVLKTGVFKEAGKTNGNEVAQQILDTYWADDNTLNGLLATLGYVIDPSGARVVPASA
jgi:hypothetical protein